MLPKRKSVPTVSTICRRVINTEGIEFNSNTDQKIENFRRRHGIKVTKNDIIFGLIFHEDLTLRSNQLELDLTIMSLDKMLELKQIVLPMAKIVYLGTLNGFSKVLIRPKTIRIFERKTKLFYFPTTEIFINAVVKNQGFRNSKQRDTYISLYDYLHFSLVSRFIVLNDHLNLINKQKNSQIQGGFQMTIVSEIMFLIEDLFTLIISFKQNIPYYTLLNSEMVNLGNKIKRYLSSLIKYHEDDYFELLSYDYDSYQGSSISKKVYRLMNKNLEQFKNDLSLLIEFSKNHHAIFRMYKHGGFPFSTPHKDSLLNNCDFYSLVLAYIPNTKFTVIPFNNRVIEFYKEIYRILYRILFNLILNKLEFIRKGARIGPFFPYDITRPLERGIANKMFQYNSNHVERYVDPFYFPKAFLREKLDFNIANYYQEH